MELSPSAAIPKSIESPRILCRQWYSVKYGISKFEECIHLSSRHKLSNSYTTVARDLCLITTPSPRAQPEGEGWLSNINPWLPWYNYFISYLIGRQNPAAKKLSNVQRSSFQWRVPFPIAVSACASGLAVQEPEQLKVSLRLVLRLPITRLSRHALVRATPLFLHRRFATFVNDEQLAVLSKVEVCALHHCFYILYTGSMLAV